MAKTHLTAAGVLRLKPAAVRREVPDAGAVGLRLVIQPSGAKSWALRFRRPGGRLAKLTLGPLDSAGNETPHQPVIGFPLTLVAARALAAEVHRQRAQDLDVVATFAISKACSKPGFIHFPVAENFGPEYYEQLDSERRQLRKRMGQPYTVWVQIRERNEVLDTFVGALAMRKSLPRNIAAGLEHAKQDRQIYYRSNNEYQADGDGNVSS
jgi:hypothetical protein